MPVVAVCETPFYGVNGLAQARRATSSSRALILLLISPLMLAIAIGVKLSSPGPVLFKQRRYGLDGREIMVYKFRTMTVPEDGDVVRQATRNDSRVTPLRRLPAPHLARRAAAVHQRAAGAHERRRAAPARRRAQRDVPQADQAAT